MNPTMPANPTIPIPPSLVASGVLPLWMVLPVTIALMIIVAAAIATASTRTSPASRRRIRLANGWVMLLTMPLAATGFTMIDSSVQPRLFVQLWILVIGLILISVMLAVLDILNTARLARLEHARLRAMIRGSGIRTQSSPDQAPLRLCEERRDE